MLKVHIVFVCYYPTSKCSQLPNSCETCSLHFVPKSAGNVVLYFVNFMFWCHHRPSVIVSGGKFQSVSSNCLPSLTFIGHGRCRRINIERCFVDSEEWPFCFVTGRLQSIFWVSGSMFKGPQTQCLKALAWTQLCFWSGENSNKKVREKITWGAKRCDNMNIFCKANCWCSLTNWKSLDKIDSDESLEPLAVCLLKIETNFNLVFW